MVVDASMMSFVIFCEGVFSEGVFRLDGVKDTQERRLSASPFKA